MGEARRMELIRGGLLLLLDAYDYAVDTEASIWDFAVEIAQLRSVGLNENEFRWLIRKGYVEHRLETTLSGDAQRDFHPVRPLRFAKRSCFMLTSRGVDVARRLVRQGDASPGEYDATTSAAPAGTGKAGIPPVDTSPFWDGERHELWLGSFLVKQFKRYARNQEAILSAFQEEGWPPRIDDPLAPEDEIETKRRLNDTIKSLNRHQRVQLLHFTGDGTAEGVMWERTDENGDPVRLCPSPQAASNSSVAGGDGRSL